MAPSQRRNLRTFWIEGGIWGAAESLSTPFISLYALAFGATSAQIGLLSSFSSLLAGLGLWPGAWLGGRWSHKLVAALTYKMLYILMPALMALLPLLLLGGRRGRCSSCCRSGCAGGGGGWGLGWVAQGAEDDVPEHFVLGEELVREPLELRLVVLPV